MEGWRYILAGTKITGDPRIPILNHIGRTNACRFLLTCNRITPAAFEHINWNAVGDCLRASPLACRT